MARKVWVDGDATGLLSSMNGRFCARFAHGAAALDQVGVIGWSAEARGWIHLSIVVDYMALQFLTCSFIRNRDVFDPP
jgi:hypothetical protein